MTHCKVCNKNTDSTSDKFKDAVTDGSGNYITVYVYSCSECGEHKPEESWME